MPRIFKGFKFRLVIFPLFICVIAGAEIYAKSGNIRYGVVSIFIVCLLFFISSRFLVFLNVRFKQTNFYKNQFIDAEKFIGRDAYQLSIPRNLEAVNLGSSQPKFAFDYTDAGMLGMNWAVGPQSFEYDFRVFQKYHSFLRVGAFVFIPICPFKFFLYRYPDDSANYKYYRFLDPFMINDYSSRTRLTHIDYPVLTAKKNMIRLIKDVPIDDRLHLDYNPMSENELKEDAQKWIKGWLKQFSLSGLDNISLSSENKAGIDKNIAILKELIDFCLERNYCPVIMILPVTKELGDLLPESFVDKYIIGNIQRANIRNVPFHNYFMHDRFISHELYFNSFFLNVKGRKLFTQTAVNDLKNLIT